MQKLKINDEVVVLAGKDFGKKGKVTNINWKTRKVLVEGVNLVKKAVRPTQEDAQGGIKDIEKELDISNVAIVSPKTGGPSRVRIENKDGKKVRVAVKCGTVLS
ncbi:MAG: 50S ribosomal protein L24 [Halobacteriovoraceae bacterium]|nr:50S ribosomal protein L24 [Halobacteriovoraceae bacterium]